jgi:hypothetical protein
VRFSVVGSEKDAAVGDALIHGLRQNAFEVDAKFNAIRSLDDLPGVSRTSESPARALLLISRQGEVLFGSALKLADIDPASNRSLRCSRFRRMRDQRRPHGDAHTAGKESNRP